MEVARALRLRSVQRQSTKALMRSAPSSQGGWSAKTEVSMKVGLKGFDEKCTVTTKAGHEGFDEKCPRQ